MSEVIEVYVSYVEVDRPSGKHFQISHMPKFHPESGQEITRLKLIAGPDWKDDGCVVWRGAARHERQVSYHRCPWHALVVVKWAGDWREELEL